LKKKKKKKKKKIGLPEKMEGFLVTSLLLSSVYRALSFLSEKKKLMILAQQPLFLTYAKRVKKI
jgi:Fe2+ or Zn2+ uptake regulation protein